MSIRRFALRLGTGSAGLSLEVPDFAGLVALFSESAGAAVSVMAANATAK